MPISLSLEDRKAFVTAESVLGALIASCSAERAAEIAKPTPDKARLAALRADTDHFLAVRAELSIRRPERTREILAEYAPLARERSHPRGGRRG